MHSLDWDFPYLWPRKPVLAANVVATTQPLAAQAGLRMLLQGGNAVDAIIATAITLTLVEPVSNGIGSDLFAVVWDGQRLHGLNASGPSPARWSPDYFSGRYSMPERGWDSVTVPGCVSAWQLLSEKFGALPFEHLFVPALEYGRRGFLVSPTIARQWAKQIPVLKGQPGFAKAFMPGGAVPAAGSIFRLPDHATSLELIAATKGEAFYRGSLAEKIAAHSALHGGVMTRSDLASYRPEWITPLSIDYRGFTLHEMPPNGQGLVALIALGILQQFDLASHPVDSGDSIHLQIEAVKLALADAQRYVADPRYMEIDANAFLSRDYLRERAQLIDLRRAQNFGHGSPSTEGTVYLTAADASGMMVSLIQSNYLGFGSGVVVDGTGISLQNRGACFVLDPGHPNQVGPCKRPFTTIIPGFVTKDQKPVMSFGVMGGTMQAQGHVQVMVRIADYHQNPQAVADAPRFRVFTGLEVNIESGFGASTIEDLAKRGHRVTAMNDSYLDFGSAQMIWKLDDGYLAASDARRDGQAVGY
jgi:gamma-glutamyltranspeptidase/glutathione hydrolase